jgi:hypothetical protein
MKILNLSAGMTLLMVFPISYGFLKLGFPAYIVFLVYIGGTIVEFFIELYILKKYIKLSLNNFLKKSIMPVFKVIVTSLLLPVCVYYFFDKGILRFIFISFSTSIGILTSSYFFAIDQITRSKIRLYIMKKINPNISKYYV